MFSLIRSLLIVAAVAVAVWFLAALAGFHISLFWTLLLSVGLTLLINLPALMRSRGRTRNRW